MRIFQSRPWVLSAGLSTAFSASVLAAAVLSAQAAGPQGTVIQFGVPKQGTLYADAYYYCWVPAEVGTVRSIIVHQHGCTREGDAQQMLGDLQWLSFAKKWHSVFIAPKLITGAPGSGSSQCSNWNDPANGSESTFLAALDSLARRSGHPEIKTVPWALWGHSGGSMWITSMTGKYPERVAAGVAEACGRDVSGVPGALRVPILHHNGKQDMCYNDTYFAAGRAKGALWAHAVNPNPLWVTAPTAFPADVEGHAPHDLRMIAIPWLEAGLAARLPDSPGAAKLKEMDTASAWLGDKGTRAIAAVADFAGGRQGACWLPNRGFAAKWAEYMEQGTLNDTSPPPPPANLTGTYAGRQLGLKWDADADLETGIKTFQIYRNGVLLTTLKFEGTSTYFTTEKGFQRWQDGDQPAPSQAPAMAYADANLNDTATYSYQVATVNWSGLAGAKSPALVLKGGKVTTGLPHAASGHRAERLTDPRGYRLVLCPEPGCEAYSADYPIHDLRGRRAGPGFSGLGILRRSPSP